MGFGCVALERYEGVPVGAGVLADSPDADGELADALVDAVDGVAEGTDQL